MIIYKIIFPNDKCYIGQTILSLEDRKRKHKLDTYKYNRRFKLQNAIRKYGWENLEWKILEEGNWNISILNNKEKYYIREFDSYHKGYNSTLGGEGIVKPNLTRKQKEHLSKINSGENNPNFGKHLSKETKLKISNKNSGFNNGMSKYFYKIISPEGKLFKVESLRKFCLEYNLNYTSVDTQLRLNCNNYFNWKIFRYNRR